MNVLACCCNTTTPTACHHEQPSGSGSWTVRLGTWTRTGANLSSSTTTGAKIEYKPSGTIDPAAMSTIMFKSSSNTGVARTIRLVLCWDVAGDNAYIVESIPTSTYYTTRISQRSSGSETIILEEFTDRPIYGASYSPEYGCIVARIPFGAGDPQGVNVVDNNPNFQMLVAFDIPAQSTNTMGIWLGTGTGTTTISDIHVYSGTAESVPRYDATPLEWYCPYIFHCEGSNCDEIGDIARYTDNIALDIDITPGGIDNGSCGTCVSDLETTFTVRYIGELDMQWDGATRRTCVWRYDFPSTICGQYLRVYLMTQNGEWMCSVTDTYAIFAGQQSGTTVGNLIVAWESFPTGGGDIPCGLSGTTFTITGGGRTVGSGAVCKVDNLSVGTPAVFKSTTDGTCLVDIP